MTKTNTAGSDPVSTNDPTERQNQPQPDIATRRLYWKVERVTFMYVGMYATCSAE
jgi:hypothetical protein